MHVSVPNPCFTVYGLNEGEAAWKEDSSLSHEYGLLVWMARSVQKKSFQQDCLNQVDRNLQNIGMALAETCFSKE